MKMEKRDLLKLFQEWRGGGIKENDRGGEFNYNIRTFVNDTMYPQYNNNIIKKWIPLVQ
jgi:hypothetical protein